MRKKASEYSLGDRFFEADHCDMGTVVSLMADPTRSTRAFILVRTDNGEYTIYSCMRDAVSEPGLARMIPEPVLRQFLFDVYVDGHELAYTPGLKTRVPVRLPEFKPAKARPVPEVDEESPLPKVSAPKSRPVEEEGYEDESEGGPAVESEPVRLLPEISFP